MKILFFLLWFLVPLTFSLRWHSEFIGIPLQHLSQFVYPVVRGQTRSGLILTATESNVFAALRPKDGSIAWRQSLREEDKMIAFKAYDEYVFTLSGFGGSTVRKLSILTGKVLWEVQDHDTHSEGVLTSENEGSGIWLDIDEAKGINDIYILSNGKKVKKVNIDTGKVAWEWESKDSETSILTTLVPVTPAVHVVSVDLQTSSSTSASLHTLSALDGSVVSSHSIPATLSSLSDIQIFSHSNPVLLWFSHSSQTLHTTILTEQALKEDKFTVSNQGEFSKGSISRLVDVGLAEKAKMVIMRQSDGKDLLIEVKGNGEAEKVWSFPSPGLYNAFFDQEGSPVLAQAAYSSVLHMGNLKLLTSLHDDPVLAGSTFAWNAQESGEILSCIVEVLPQEGKDKYQRRPFRYLLTGSVGEITLNGEGQEIWIRDESLTKWIEDGVTLVDAVIEGEEKVKEAQEAEGKKAFAFERSLVHNILRFLGASSVLGEEEIQPDEFDDLLGTRTGSTKLAIGSSRDGVVTAVDLGNDGKVLWRTRLDKEAVKEGIRELKRVDGGVVVITKEAEQIKLDLITGNIIRSTNPTPIAFSASYISNASFSSLSLPGQLPLGFPHYPALSSKLAFPFRTLASGEVLLRYLDPSVFAAVLSEGTKTTVYLIDGESGSLIFESEIEGKVFGGANGVKVMLVDNWLVYSFRREGVINPLDEVVSTEVYWGENGGKQRLKTVQQSFVLNINGVVSMSASRTALGITTKNLIVANSFGEIFSIPRRLLDPRRPTGKPSKFDQEDMLIPYEPVIPPEPKWIVSGSEPVYGIRGLTTSPSTIESTSLVFAFGVDLFLGSVTPSQPFDILSSNFNKAQLLATITGLSIAIMVTKPIVKRRQLHAKWYS